MKLYAFELGRKKELCIAELLSILGRKNLVEQNPATAIFRLTVDNPQQLQNRLGGTIKIIEILAETDQKNLKNAIEQALSTFFQAHKGKATFGITLLNFKNRTNINIKELLNFSKIFLKSFGVGSRFINIGTENPKPSTIYKSQAQKKGIDLNIIEGKQTLYLGRGVAIQNIDAYSLRDYHKPVRDTLVGMLPPKLAQIMINLAGKETETIYDPFCGTGTILMEGMLMGKTTVGSDIDPAMVQATEKNCRWLKGKFLEKGYFRVFQRDARFLNKKFVPEGADTIVTESYLGKPLKRPPSTKEQEIIFRDLANLHINWLKAVHTLLPKNGRIVTAITALRVNDKIVHFPNFEEIARTAGYKIKATYIYDRPDQLVAREIKVLEKISD